MEARLPSPRVTRLDQGDWSLLDAVRKRPPFWRDDRDATAGNPEMPRMKRVDVLIMVRRLGVRRMAGAWRHRRCASSAWKQGELDQVHRPAHQRPRLGGPAATRISTSAQRRGATTDYPRQRRQLGDEDRNFNGSAAARYLHAALAAHAPVGLQGEVAGRRGRRLADRLLGAGRFYDETPHDGRVRPAAIRACAAQPAHAADSARQDRKRTMPGR